VTSLVNYEPEGREFESPGRATLKPAPTFIYAAFPESTDTVLSEPSEPLSDKPSPTLSHHSCRHAEYFFLF
jgi:hypothetical protein